SNSRKPELEAELGARFRPLDDLLREADFLVVVVPLNDRTRHMIGAREFELMKPDAILINIARGPVVDEQALIAALTERRIQAAGLDVYEQEPLRESPLFRLPNVVTLPHIGSATHETRKAMAELAIDNLEQALLGGTPPCMLTSSPAYSRGIPTAPTPASSRNESLRWVPAAGGIAAPLTSQAQWACPALRMLIAPTRSAFSSKPHSTHRNRACVWRLSADTWPQAGHVRDVFCGGTTMRCPPAHASL